MNQTQTAAPLISTLEHLLSIEVSTLAGALNDAALYVAQSLRAEKVDAFLLETDSDTLVAVGVSDTPLGQRQRAIGMDRLPLANGGRMVEVFRSGASFIHGRADQDPVELRGIVEGLGVRSTIATPLEVGNLRRGVLAVTDTRPDFFNPDDLRFLEVVVRWVGMLGHRAELVEQISAEALERGRQIVAEELVTMLAHDLRNYIAPVKGRLDMLRRRAQRDERPRDMQDISAALFAMSRFEALIEDLLDAGRLETGMFAIEEQAVDLSALVRETINGIDAPDVSMRVQTPPDAVACVDPRRVRQALENLLSNAIKHSPTGSAIDVEVESFERRATPHVAILVRDQGTGVAPNVLPHLFQRFASGGPGGGLGLGLYMAQRIAVAHGGELTYESRPGQGAAFRLVFPIGDTGSS
jgi:signal transduction histidine kinase